MGFLENAYKLLSGKGLSRLNDNVASLSQGIFQECLRIKVRSIEIIVYCFVYENFRIYSLPWDSPFTWYLCLIGIDFGFYWAHRFAHEVNIIWAIHQAHHSAEDFVMTSALRQALLQPFTAWLTYVPLALFIPPSIFLAHLQLGELYMFWLHTEIIHKLGPLEYILNTPSHHRVHHGRNAKYIDKNFGGTFIIWDRIFGTFEPEDPEEPAVYGLVHPVQSYNPFYLQLHHWGAMWSKMRTMQGWRNKVNVFFMGPGWEPGKPRLGLISDIPKIEYPVVPWDPQIHLIEKVYVIWHFALTVIFYHELTLRHGSFSQFVVTCSILSLIYSITSLGFILEGRWFAPLFELLRCLLFFGVEQWLLPVVQPLEHLGAYRLTAVYAIRMSFLVSAIASSIYSLHKVAVKCNISPKSLQIKKE
ncbi:Alkylglycerol monooxygenase-like protein [Leptotrombidium deliense]|uniref:Alkylglycerol monooxygenase n=1 Tax=Leptotrombidium deliense TaxID=299467 RepID=A0A443SVL5_9ACAR|nr:Alkylglycerol monooxygenase-like protein [Leptotrombidium deliense]